MLEFIIVLILIVISPFLIVLTAIGLDSFEVQTYFIISVLSIVFLIISSNSFNKLSR